MEQVLRRKMSENSDRFIGVIEAEKEMNLSLDTPIVENLLKMALDIKSTSCNYDIGNNEGEEGLNCAFPISDEKNKCQIHIKLFTKLPVDAIELYVAEVKKVSGHLGFLHFSQSNYIEVNNPKRFNIKDELKDFLKNLEGEYSNNINFQILKEYLEEED